MLWILILALVWGYARAGPSDCDPSYDCYYLHELTNGSVIKWDFSSLCSASEYAFHDRSNPNLANLTYSFNICGSTSSSCYTKAFTNPYPRGVAIQSWGWAPSCPPAEKTCSDATGTPVCCSAPCNTLSTGAPQFIPVDREDPLGGISVNHTGIPPDDMDPSECPYDPRTGGFLSRTVSFLFKCDPSVPTLEVDGVVENPQCRYTIFLRSKAGCASVIPCH